ncbi:hypothetical protein K2173_028471 [Erythroxylum novogranatense]|uniref:ARM repeat N-terminal plant domain-containing protein n=1 Tax=Erythroxylum novogranatense TaxID=1862640 RepID=A0AAV8U5A5_9ROSI|nr:hypothetical protein K2173_028471 [Erythroxylum novogranatense]
MDFLNKKEKTFPTITAFTTMTNSGTTNVEKSCSDPSCFFCTLKEPESAVRRAGIASCFKKMPFRDNQDDVLVLSRLWNIAMTQPNDPELPSLGIFDCMARMIQKSIKDRRWLLRDQNIYTPYYAAHVIGSYTMNKFEFAEKAVESGVIAPLLGLLRGNISWIEQRAAVRALGHLASYERTFKAVTLHEKELVELAMKIASTCLETVYREFVGVKDANKRLKYHRNLLTKGVEELETENRKAEEWASQLQCWSLYLLNCFASKGRSLSLICRREFLRDLAEMWGGLVNHASPAGVGLIRILCYSKIGRKSIAECKEVIKNLCNLSRSSDDWQYMGIDCLLLLLKDQDTRYNVIEIATSFLVDLVDLRSLGERSNVGEKITKALLLDYEQNKLKLTMSNKVHKFLEEIWDLKVEKRKKEKLLSDEKVEERRVLVGLIKQEANHMFLLGDIEESLSKYTEALQICPLRLRKERMIIYSNRAQCQLLLRNPEAAISDSTRALCLSNPANIHSKSLWRRSQAYDMKGLAKESLMDSIIFLNSCVNSGPTKRVKIPYYAAYMISKQMDATWLFASAKSNVSSKQVGQELEYDELLNIVMDRRGSVSGLHTITEEPFVGKEGSGRKLETARRRKAPILARSM